MSEIGDEASLPVLALLMTAMGLFLMPVQAAFSRAMERRADRFAVELTRNGAAYARAMEGWRHRVWPTRIRRDRWS